MKVLIIGGTSGIGRAMAEAYAKRPNVEKVGVTGRRHGLLETLKAAAPDKIVTRAFDICAPDALEQIDALIQEMGGLDLAVYSSGLGKRTEHFDDHIINQAIQIMVVAFTKVCNHLFDYFAAQKHGHLAGIASIAGLRGLGDNNAYGACKSFIITYLEDLEHISVKRKLNVTVTTLIPGFIRTDLIGDSPYFWVAPLHKATAAILRALDRKKHVAYITRRWAIIAFILRRTPRWLLDRLF